MAENFQVDHGLPDNDLLQRVLARDHDAIALLFQQTLERLKGDIACRLPARMRRHTDEDDLANSVMKSFFQGIAAERFPCLSDEDDLWQVLGMLAKQKIAKHIRRATAQKRGSGRVRGESVFGDVGEHGNNVGLDGVAGASDNVVEELVKLEGIDEYLQMLPNDRMREIALLRLQGYANDEIAIRQETSVRTIGRKLQLIRSYWSEAIDANTD